MLKQKNNLVESKVTSFSDEIVNIDAGSVVFDNKWISYKSILFNLRDYITSVLVSPRTTFFQNRSYAVYIVVGIDFIGNIAVREGLQVPFVSVDTVPIPTTLDIIPLVGIVAIQDGSSDLEYGFKPLKNSNIFRYSGAGNILNKNLVGVEGPLSDVYGYTGIQGYTGLIGEEGLKGEKGITGLPGILVLGEQGSTGIRGLTGINWNIHFPFINFV